ncbi:MAG: LamG domain-containing protein, partial [Solirubrobacterales bacterium]
VVNVLRAAEQAGTALPGGSHPVWVTEFWWDSNPPNSVGAPLDVQAAWIEQSLYLFWKAGASAAVNFQLGDTSDRPDAHAGFQSGVYFGDGSLQYGRPKPSLTAFRFPFVTERIDNQTLRAWGKAPEKGTLQIQQQQGAGWVTIKKLQVSKGAVFATTLPSSGKTAMRATVGASQSLVWQGFYGTTVLDTPGLVSYWRLGEMSGTNANDWAGANDGTYTNTPTLGVTGALIGDPDTAVSLNAAQNEYVNVGDAPMLDVGDMFSVELWFKRTGSAIQTLIDKGPTGLDIWLQNGLIYFGREGDSSYLAVSNRTYPDTNWHHLVVKKNGTAAKIFVDGVNVTALGTNATVQNTADPFNIGSDSPTPGHSFSGSVDEVALYNSALSLSATTIANHYHAAGY